MRTTIIISLIILSTSCSEKEVKSKDESNPIISYSDFESLVMEVKQHREDRLINLDAFLKMSKVENTIILDTRSKEMYDRKHIEGAIHLNFSDFTQENLARVIPNFKSTILIYCNNNFIGDEINFASKIVIPNKVDDGKGQVSLALNIPTYINLYGYGYKNVYELSELISIFDSRIKYEGSATLKN